MASFSYDDIEALYKNNNKVFKKITAYLKDEHNLSFVGAKKSTERQLDRYLRAFNKHYNDIQAAFSKTLNEVAQDEHTPKTKKTRGKVNEKA